MTIVGRATTMGDFLYVPLVLVMILIGLCGCSHLGEGFHAGSAFEEASAHFDRGSYRKSLKKYEQILEKYPARGDRALFEMGIIHTLSDNPQKDYQKSRECFQRVVKEYPSSSYRKDSEMMIFSIANVILKDQVIASQQKQITDLQTSASSKEREIATLQEEIAGKRITIETLRHEIAALERKISVAATGTRPADKILVEKKARRLTLISKGEKLKTYRIALGGNPNGPKEREGDNKTPEGTYLIDSRNRDSSYHLSLHISYPEERDIRRAKELGVAPGGDITIHGLKNGFSQFGGLHREIDWTQGCIAVTDEEIEEIDKLVPDGTLVEIRP